MTSLQSEKSRWAAMTLGAIGLSVAFVSSGCAASAQPKSPAPVNLGDNAALKYWIAFGAMPDLSPAEEEKLFQTWKKFPMDKATVAVIDRSKVCLDVLRQAAQIRPCDWGLIKNAPGILMPHLGQARKAVRLARLRARYLARELDSEGAVSDLLSVFALSRQVNSDGTVQGFVVQCDIEKMATDVAARCLKRLDLEQLRRLAVGLDALPERKGFREAVLSDQADAKWWDDQVNAKDDKTRENTVKMMLMMSGSKEAFTDLLGAFAGEEPSRARAEKAWADKKLTPEEMSRYTRGFDKAPQHYKALAEAASLPLPEFDRKVEAIQDQMETDCPFVARFLFGMLPTLRYWDAESEARMTMLKAGIAVVLGGSARVKEFKDPFGDGPFEYSRDGEGFELKSKLTVNDKPITLRFSELP